MSKILTITCAAALIAWLSACAPAPAFPPVAPAPSASPTVAAAVTDPPAPSPTQTVAATAEPTHTPPPSPTPAPTPAVLIGAADVAVCGQGDENQNDEATAEIVEQMLSGAPDAVVFIPGDVVYDSGTTAEYENCFGPSWGRFKERIRPVPGNHDYKSGGAPYFSYFGAAAGEAGKGYYSYDVGDWHIVALNSNCNDIACGPDSPQVRWLEEDLRASTAKCTLAYWHHPRFTSGLAGDTGVMNPIWRTAVENGVDVVVSGHDHDYERFAPLDAAGQPDPNGTRQFIVGTGGAYLRPFGEPKPASEVRLSGTHGVIRFNLYPDRYEWQFIPQDDPARTDSGEGECH